MNRGYLFATLFVICFFSFPRFVHAQRTETQDNEIQVVKQDGMNLIIPEDGRIDSHHIVVTQSTPTHNYWCGLFSNLPTDTATVIGFSLADSSTHRQAANVSKWDGHPGLVPVMSYSDPTKYETYIWYSKNDKGWWSSDIFSKDRFAGTGTLPEQQSVPREVATQFLSQDGKYFSCWREVDDEESVTTLNIFRIKHRYKLPTAIVGMRIPYTYTYEQAYIDKLRTSKFPGVKVSIDDIGITPEKREMRAIRIDNSALNNDNPEHKTVVVIAREHANEQDSSFTLQGVLSSLLSSDASAARVLKNTTWIFIPIEDVDGAFNSRFDDITDCFARANDPSISSEVFAYARYFAAYINGGNTIDAVVSFHCTEAKESPNMFSPFIDRQHKEDVKNINQAFFSALKKAGYQVGDPVKPWDFGTVPTRLFGWIGKHYGAIPLTWEANGRFPSHRLNLCQLVEMGGYLTNSLCDRLSSDDGERLHNEIRSILAKRVVERDIYLTDHHMNPFELNDIQVLSLGY